MIIETKEVYKCEFCRKLYEKKYFAERHEENCKLNPKNDRACLGCPILRKVTATYIYDDYIGQRDTKVSVLYCEAINKCLYPPGVERKGNAYEILYVNNEEKLNDSMPKECDVDINKFMKNLM